MNFLNPWLAASLHFEFKDFDIFQMQNALMKANCKISWWWPTNASFTCLDNSRRKVERTLKFMPVPCLHKYLVRLIELINSLDHAGNRHFIIKNYYSETSAKNLVLKKLRRTIGFQLAQSLTLTIYHWKPVLLAWKHFYCFLALRAQIVCLLIQDLGE